MRAHDQLTTFVVLIVGLWTAPPAYADDPTSNFVPLPPLASTLGPSGTGQMIALEIWSQATGGSLIYSEAHTVDTDAGSNITNDTGNGDLLLGRPNGLVAGNFPYPGSRYLDATQGGMSLLAARVPLYASIFGISSSGSFSGNITMVNSTAVTGNLIKGSSIFLHNFGTHNTFLGELAGAPPVTGGDNTGLGFHALNADTSGASNTAAGSGALQNNTAGSYNTAAGSAALQANTTGSSNTGIGYDALLYNTTGGNNTAVGSNALTFNTTGSFNTAHGQGALYFNSTGYNNTATGFHTIETNQTGHDNTAHGYNALQASTASYNTASGSGALQANTTGQENTAHGFNALRSNTTGSSNTAVGSGALYSNTTGSHNTAHGHQALLYNTIGDNNTAVGDGALVSNTGGHENTAIGSGALMLNQVGQHNTANGFAALSSSVGSWDNTAVGWEALANNTTGSGNTAVGIEALLSNQSGSNNTAIGFFAGTIVNLNLNNTTAIGSGAVVNASNKIRLGNTAVTVIEGQVGFTSSSDATKKENFRPVDGQGVLEKIRKLALTSWNFIGHDPLQFRHYGPTAQDFFAAFGNDGMGKVGTPITITSTDMDGILMIAAQALEQRTREHKKKLDALEGKNLALEAENAELRARLESETAELRARLEALERRSNP